MSGFGSTRPVGEALPVFPMAGRSMTWPTGYLAVWLDSGTSALAVVARALVLQAGEPAPRIALPAYTCPDVVSAVVWAGARPVLVDTLPGLPWIDDAALTRQAEQSWVGMIAPHFLGLAHPMKRLAGWCRETGVTLIEDSAQLSPWSPAFAPTADFVMLSFGRGKPIPAGGGVLLFRETRRAAVAEVLENLPCQRDLAGAWRLRAVAHNIALTRGGFSLVSKLPGLLVGETRYKRLESPRRLGASRSSLAESVVAGWNRAPGVLAADLEDLVSALGYVSVARNCQRAEGQALLRLPVLAPSAEQRERVCADSRSKSAGISRMYVKILAEIEGMPPTDRLTECRNARDFASRLLTLPVHSGVTRRHLALLREILEDEQAPRRGVI